MFYLQCFSGKVVAVLLLAATVTMGVWADTSESVDHASQFPTLAPDVEGSSEVATPEENKGAVLSEECLAFRSKDDADLGDVLRAGCKPTLAQMSALMDNPLGNVAMLFTQTDSYRMKDPDTGKTQNQHVYTGIAQFPLRLNEDWNLINRVIWTVPSVPLDQDKIDDFDADDFFSTVPGGGYLGSGGGSAPLPVDVFEGRTTGFGDAYYVGLFAPTEPKDVLTGKLVWGVGFDLGFPTASEDILGTGKYSAGPSGLAAYLGKKWKVGGLV